MRFQNLIHQPLLKYKFKQLIDIISPLAQLVEGLPHNLKVQGSNPYSSLQVDDRLNIDREFWSQVICKAYTCGEEIKLKKFHKTQVTIPFFFMLIFYYLMCKVCILQTSRKDVASIHTSLASCEHYDWSVLAASILHARFVPKIRMRKHSARTNVRLQYACCTLACCVLAARRLRAFFSARGMFAIFIRVFIKKFHLSKTKSLPNLEIKVWSYHSQYCLLDWYFHLASSDSLLLSNSFSKVIIFGASSLLCVCVYFAMLIYTQ